MESIHTSRLDTPITQAIRIVATAHFFQRRCKITTYFINYQTFSRLSEKVFFDSVFYFVTAAKATGVFFEKYFAV